MRRLLQVRELRKYFGLRVSNALVPFEPAQVPQSHRYTMVSLQPVWIPNVEPKPGDIVKPERKGRAKSPGPNGEAPDSGKWCLRMPDGSVYDGPSVSASALETASECVYKWALDRLDQNEKPENRKADLGGLRHDELEAWVKYGTRVQTEGMAKVIEHFPMPGQMESEVYFGILFGRPGHEVVFAGYLDGRESIVPTDEGDYAGGGYDVEQDEDGEVLTLRSPIQRFNSTIRDLKTTGDFRWKKNAAQLRSNIQSCLYGLGEMLRVEEWRRSKGVTLKSEIECDAVILKWTYAQLKENKEGIGVIKRVETVCECAACARHGGSTSDPEHAHEGGVLLTKEEAVTTMAQYLPLAEMLSEAIKTEKKAKDVEKNYEACAGYGGCGWKKIGICESPTGSGFKSLLKQERARMGIDTGESRVLVQIGTGSGGFLKAKETQTRALTAPAQGKKMASLGARFGTKNGAAGPSTAAVVATTPAKPVAVVAKATEAPAAGAKPSRFAGVVAKAAPKTPAAAATAEVAKLDQKATEDGMASGAEAAPATKTTTSGALKARLQGLGKGVAAAAVDKAPTHAVGATLAVGINPPDAAPEWTAEQQAAEAERIAKRYGSVESGSAELLEPEVVPTEGAASDAVEAPRGRGRPKGSTKAKPASEAADNGPCEPAQAQAVLDDLAMRLIQGGFRSEAALVMDLSAKLAS